MAEMVEFFDLFETSKTESASDCDTTEGYFSDDTSIEKTPSEDKEIFHDLYDGGGITASETVANSLVSPKDLAELIDDEEFEEAVEILSENTHLVNKSYNDHPLFFLALLKESFLLSMKFMELGVDQMLCDNDGNTALHLATWEPALIMSIINKNQVNVNAKNNSGETCLFFAVRQSHVLSCELLLAHNIDTSIQNLDGDRAFDMNTDTSLNHLLQQREEMSQISNINTKAVERALLNCDINEKKQEILYLKPCAIFAQELKEKINKANDEIEQNRFAIESKRSEILRLETEIESRTQRINDKEIAIQEDRLKFQPFESFLQKYDALQNEMEELKNIAEVEREVNPIYNFECPICCEIFQKRKKIYQCSQGHYLCESCRNNVNRCPTCRETLGNTFIRNRVLESLVETML